jgi:hypothetical protein
MIKASKWWGGVGLNDGDFNLGFLIDEEDIFFYDGDGELWDLGYEEV